MKNTVEEYFQKIPNKRFLLACSGGVDSMVLADLMKNAEVDFSLAHCNFKLREKDSDQDEELVRKWADKNKIDAFTIDFDTKKYQEEKSLNIQLAARELRYNWFDKLMLQEKYDFLITAHHANDSLETFLINLGRGTGIAGLLGISDREIKRPLLKFTKAEIYKYAQENKVPFREDTSNKILKYKRNKIRELVVKPILKIQPDFLKSFYSNVKQLTEDYEILSELVTQKRKTLFKPKNEEIYINKKELLDCCSSDSWWFHLFKPYGFIKVKELQKICRAETGKSIYSKKYQLLSNREELILVELSKQIIEAEKVIYHPEELAEIIGKERYNHLEKTIDFEKLTYPLTLGKAEIGDLLYPSSMRGKKKLSKFFKDLKLSSIEKSKIKILKNGNKEIIWVVDYRFDRRFIKKH